jgi:RNA polymerase sigma-70 factor (ECF subfamily)
VDLATEPLSPALETALTRFGGLIRRSAGRHGLAGADVDELEQEVRIRLWKALRTGEKIRSAPASYVQRTAASAAIDLLRRRRARREEPLPEDPGRAPTLAPTVEVRLESVRLRTAIADALGRMLDSRQAVVRMHLAGYPQEEIAELLGWSEAKTRNLLYRGMADLRTRLAELGIGREGGG